VKSKQEFIKFLTDDKDKLDNTTTAKIRLLTDELNALKREMFNSNNISKEHEIS